MAPKAAVFLSFFLAASQYLIPHAALAQDAEVKPHVPLAKTIGQVTPTGPVPSLYVLNSAGAKLEGTTLTMSGVSMNSIVFADRPIRAAGHLTTEQFVMQWDQGKGSFADDPPNATISVLGGNGSKVEDAVITIMNPKLEGGNLTFEVAVLEGSLSGGSGPAALFIDRGGFSFGGGGFGGGGFAGGGFHGGGVDGGGFRGGFAGGNRDVHINDVHANYWHAPDYHGAWYAGAGLVTGVAIGAAATAPYRYGYGYCGVAPKRPDMLRFEIAS
ncbi:hypothetical protein GGQ64_004761 [Rhizobium azooxidifex]|uniref:Uncharacterized protein n=1 Tax=Mycoplana azooxidifex TaxID=1636188 RepID=A0A7W6GLL1_9HYPH|nr:hypothetical protein [Mycoplana azooxidifex]MBB3979517.1 hypothetical protein [Mycoplana azooxidifex]